MMNKCLTSFIKASVWRLLILFFLSSSCDISTYSILLKTELVIDRQIIFIPSLK